MTPTAALVAELQARGVTLEPRGDTLRVRPVSKLTPEEVETLRRHKAEVLALLASCKPPDATAPAPPAAPKSYAHPFPDALPGLGPRQVIPFSPCGDCETDPPADRAVKIGTHTTRAPGDRGTWTAYSNRPLCLRHARGRA